MARIAKVGTWAFSGELQSTVTSTNLKREIAWMIKEALVAAGMVVKSSSNRVTAGNADYWGSYLDILVQTVGNIGTWLVLQHPTGGGEMLIAFNYTNYNTCRFFFSAVAGFTGGTLEAIPTASDQMSLGSIDLLNTNQATIQAMVSASGTFRCIMLQSNIVRLWLVGEKIRDAHSDLLGGYFFRVQQTTNPMAYTTVHRVAYTVACLWSDGSAITVRTCTPGIDVSALGEVWNETSWDGYYPNTPIDLVSVTSTKQGLLGRFEDAWFGPSTGINTGDTMPDAGGNPMRFVQFDHIIWPWDGTVPVIG